MPQPLDYASSPETRQTGPNWLAIGLSAASLIIFAMFLLIPIMEAWQQSRPGLPRCPQQMRQIGLALMMYSHDNGGDYPPSLGTLLVTQELSPNVFVCPESGVRPANAPTVEEMARQIDEQGFTSYIYLGAGLTSEISAETIVLYEPITIHGNGLYALHGDGTVLWWEAKKADKLFAELEAGHNPPRPDRLE